MGLCDLIPGIMSNALNNAIIVINKMDPGYSVYVAHPFDHDPCKEKSIWYFDLSNILVLYISGDHYGACVKLHQNESMNTEPCIINCISTVGINSTERRIESSDVNSSELGVINSADSNIINSIAPDIIYHTEPDLLNDT